MADRISGTREWAVKNVNCVNGCEHNCRYCYARWNVVERFHLIEEGEWENPQVREKDDRACPEKSGQLKDESCRTAENQFSFHAL
jgi:DNA repair photolyase